MADSPFLVRVELHASNGPRSVVRDAASGRPLVVRDDRFVALVEIPRFDGGTGDLALMPEVLVWGDRVFVRAIDQRDGLATRAPDFVYLEVFAVAVVRGPFEREPA